MPLIEDAFRGVFPEEVLADLEYLERTGHWKRGVLPVWAAYIYFSPLDNAMDIVLLEGWKFVARSFAEARKSKDE